MQQTNEYKLNQWELSDQIKMEDFNADNAKIEAQLAELRRQILELTYHLSQVTAAEIADRERCYMTFRLMQSDAFADPDIYTYTNNITVANHQAVLAPGMEPGVISTIVKPASGKTHKEFLLWFHHLGGKVTPTLNGEAMTPLYHHQDFTAMGSIGMLWAYRWAGTYSGTRLNLAFQLQNVYSSGESQTGSMIFQDYSLVHF